ncbi:RHS repeat-associated core domain-containing protein [Photobacterium swingsii]|uniref:RHS repeat-associated core domain-containing protein n=1 Tax=Photobacterium swingsii TaxID=680026 RepID=UPI003D0A1E32
MFNQQGQRIGQYDYSPYGSVGSSNYDLQLFGMSIKHSDFASGLVYFGYRFYMPNLGRWLNRDPLQEQGGINLYAYVNGDPLGYVDPDGKEAVLASICAVAAAYDTWSGIRDNEDDIIDDLIKKVNDEIEECAYDDIGRREKLSDIRKKLMKLKYNQLSDYAASNNTIDPSSMFDAIWWTAICGVSVAIPLP